MVVLKNFICSHFMSYQVRPSRISSIFSTKCWFNLNLYNSCQLIESSTLHKVKNYTWFFFIWPMRHAPSADWPISPFLASQYILPETNWFVNSTWCLQIHLRISSYLYNPVVSHTNHQMIGMSAQYCYQWGAQWYTRTWEMCRQSRCRLAVRVSDSQN